MHTFPFLAFEAALLVVGQSNNSDQVNIPSLIGFTYNEALNLINGNNFVLGIADFDVQPTNEAEKNLFVTDSV